MAKNKLRNLIRREINSVLQEQDEQQEIPLDEAPQYVQNGVETLGISRRSVDKVIRMEAWPEPMFSVVIPLKNNITLPPAGLGQMASRYFLTDIEFYPDGTLELWFQE